MVFSKESMTYVKNGGESPCFLRCLCLVGDAAFSAGLGPFSLERLVDQAAAAGLKNELISS
jgi:hypothetical protein